MSTGPNGVSRTTAGCFGQELVKAAKKRYPNQKTPYLLNAVCKICGQGGLDAGRGAADAFKKGYPGLPKSHIITIDHALTRPWTVTKTYIRERNPRWAEYNCQPPPDAVFIGFDEYRMSPDGRLMPLRPGQPPVW